MAKSASVKKPSAGCLAVVVGTFVVDAGVLAGLELVLDVTATVEVVWVAVLVVASVPEVSTKTVEAVDSADETVVWDGAADEDGDGVPAHPTAVNGSSKQRASVPGFQTKRISHISFYLLHHARRHDFYPGAFFNGTASAGLAGVIRQWLIFPFRH